MRGGRTGGTGRDRGGTGWIGEMGRDGGGTEVGGKNRGERGRDRGETGRDQGGTEVRGGRNRGERGRDGVRQGGTGVRRSLLMCPCICVRFLNFSKEI